MSPIYVNESGTDNRVQKRKLVVVTNTGSEVTVSTPTVQTVKPSSYDAKTKSVVNSVVLDNASSNYVSHDKLQ